VGRFEFNSRKPSTFEVNVNRVVSQPVPEHEEQHAIVADWIFSTQMVLWQNGTKKHTKQRGSENAGEGDKQDYD
jgi:hypothetical protein